MKSDLNILKKAYDMIGNDYLRAISLRTMESMGIRKDLVRLDTNDLCNIQCIMCGTHTRKGKADHFMSLENFKKVIDLFAPSARLMYLGCAFEPLVTPGFAEYILYVKSKKVPFISFPTNGILLNPEISRLLVDERIDEIIISWNGYNRDDYNRIMHRSSYDKLIENIDFLHDYKKQKNSEFPKIRINTIFMKSNLEKFDEFLKLFGKYDVVAAQFRELLFTNDMNDPEEVTRELATNIDKNELDTILKNIRSHALRLSKEGKQIILPKSLVQKDRIESAKSVSVKAHCSVPYFSIWIEHNGTVKSCIFDSNAILGNVFTDPIEKIRGNQNRFRKMALNGKCRNETCLMNVDSSSVI
ncbi:MAG: radical SAM protein [bacterium]|nr:radical SAM protein [bacterium]